MAAGSKFAVVTVDALDFYSAADVARDVYRRHLDLAVPQQNPQFRSPASRIAIREVQTAKLHGYRDDWAVEQPDNDAFARAVAANSVAAETLDRVHYWYYQGFHAQGHAQLVGHWTAL